MNFVQAVQGLMGRIYTVIYSVTSSVVIEFVHLAGSFIQNNLNCIKYTVDHFILSLGIKLTTLGHFFLLRCLGKIA